MNLDIPTWKNIAVTIRDSVVELRVHSDGGSLLWNATVHQELTDAFYWVGTSHEFKVLIITGTGDDYCTELDTTSFAAVPWEHIWWEGRRMLSNLNDIEIPVIAAINGPATIHSEIPMMGDIVIAAEHTEFADRAHFATRDTVPGDGVNLVWGELLGATRSKYYLLTGAGVSAQEAKQIGFVNEVVAREDVLTRAWELALDLARRELPMLRYTKTVLSIGFRENFTAKLSHGLGVEGSGHWSRGGIKPVRVSAADAD